MKRLLSFVLAIILVFSGMLSLSAGAEDVFGGVCPICGEDCGYSAEPRTDADCTHSAMYYVHCNSIEDFALVEVGNKNPDFHLKSEHIKTVEPTCTEDGYDVGYCSSCKKEYRYNITPALNPSGHVWGEWTVTKTATASADGEKMRECTVCGKTEVKTIPASESSRFIKSVSLGDVTVNYKSGMMLNPKIVSADGAKISVEYKSSAPDTVSVDSSGNIKALKAGSAVIEASVTDADGFTVKDTCTVTVKYAWWQWLIKIVLLGFLWY